MGVTSTQPTSRRGYLSQAELEQFEDITVTNPTEADDKISQAEELIDAFIGPQDSYLQEVITGLAAAAGALSLTLEASQQNTYDIDYLKLCEIEILGGTGVGQRRKITANTKAGVLTIDAAWTTTPSTDSFYRISQLGKFPRRKDYESYSANGQTTIYKYIPEAVKRAVAAQVGYFIEMGDDFFKGDKSDMESESVGDYSYTKGQGVAALYRMIAPRAKVFLRGIINRTGQIEI